MNPKPQKVWRLREADPNLAERLEQALQIHPLVAEILAGRGIRDEASAREFIHPRLGGLSSPEQMAGLATVVGRLGQAVLNREKIGVFGDYDVDGVSSTALLGDYLRRCDARFTLRVARRSEGYGFGLAQAEEMKARECSLLVLLDCGSSDQEAVQRAVDSGLEVVALDHHKVTREDWPGLALVNPQRADCDFPYKGLCTAGLTFYLVARLRRYLDAHGKRGPDPRDGLDLVALGTIADVAPLDGDNRILVSRGLDQLTRTNRPGLRALLQLCRLDHKEPTSGEVSWILSPRLNAPGRMGDASVSLDCLWQADRQKGIQGARECYRINEERKNIQGKAIEQALEQGEAQAGEGQAFILAASADWHPGILGIVASKLVETFNRPAGVIHWDASEGRGSARSIPGVDLMGLLARCEELLVRYGGHKYAAGFALNRDNFEPLSHRLHDLTGPLLGELGGRVIDLDGIVSIDRFDLPLCRQLKQLEPYGQANPAPLFAAQGVEVTKAMAVGERHLRLYLSTGGKVQEAIGFGMVDSMPQKGDRVDVVFVPEINNYQGERVQLRLRDLQPAGALNEMRET